VEARGKDRTCIGRIGQAGPPLLIREIIFVK
jgi:hypothetical protein